MEAFTEALTEALTEELSCKTVFTIPLFGGIEIAESVVVTWIIMAILLFVSFVVTRRLKTRNVTTLQAAVESMIQFLDHLVRDVIGEKGAAYIPFLMTILLFIGISNLIGLLGLKPPTKDMNVTVALSLISILLIEIAGIRGKGAKGWLKSFAQPSPVLIPINIMELVIRPLSLCMRLFGNVLGAFVVMELIKLLTKFIFPAVFSLYFDIFDGLIQAYVFVFLTSLYIKEAVE